MAKTSRQIHENALPDRLPMDVMPCSNEEFIPPEPTPAQKTIMRQAMEECDRMARKLGVSRRRFLQTGAAYAVCLSVFNRVTGRNQYAWADGTATNEACDLEFDPGNPGENHPFGIQQTNPEGEFVIDCQTHHVDSGGEWRIRNPGTSAFMTVGFSQARACNELDPMECLSRYHYFKELYLDSSTNIGILSTLPYKDDDAEPPNGQALPFREAIETARMIERAAGNDPDQHPLGLGAGRRIYVHKFVMPNRGSAGARSDGAIGKGAFAQPPLFWGRELELMQEAVAEHGNQGTGYLRAWKVYTPWGDVPYATGWWLDDPAGHLFIQSSLDLVKDGFNPLICCHKGFALPAFDQEKAATRDVGIVANQYWSFPNGGNPAPAFEGGDGEGMNFMIYHSGYDGEGTNFLAVPPTNQGTSAQSPYYLDFDPDTREIGLGINPDGDADVRSIDRGTDNFIKSLRENGWSARHFAGGVPGRPGTAGDGNPAVHANVPNVYGELGAVWSSVSGGGTEEFVWNGQTVQIDRASFLLGKLIYYVGAKRITWGTDSLWFGSPEDQIRRLRHFNMHPAICDLYNLPWGLDGDADDPTQPAAHPSLSIRNAIFGRNAARVYGIDVGATIAKISCDDVQKIRDQYVINPLASHEMYGPRTRRELLASIRRDPWHRGVIREQNEAMRQSRPFTFWTPPRS